MYVAYNYASDNATNLILVTSQLHAFAAIIFHIFSQQNTNLVEREKGLYPVFIKDLKVGELVSN